MSRVRCYVTCVLLIGVASVVFPRPSAATAGRPDGQAIQFGIGVYLNLSIFDEATLAYQRFIRPDVAWRLGLGVDLRLDSGDISMERTGVNSTDGSSDISKWDYGVSVSSEWLVYRGDQVSVFFGGGPRVSYTSYRNEDWYFSGGDSMLRRRSVESYSAGLKGCIGVQWAATDWLAFHAEYNARCTYEHTVDEDVRTETGSENYSSVATETIDRVFLDSRGVRFGLSAYF